MRSARSTLNANYSLANAFAVYASAAVGTANPELHQAMRRAFYCGAFAHNALLQGIVELPAEAQAQMMNSVESELRVFQATLGSTVEGKV